MNFFAIILMIRVKLVEVLAAEKVKCDGRTHARTHGRTDGIMGFWTQL
jgi:hypothetical protein